MLVVLKPEDSSFASLLFRDAYQAVLLAERRGQYADAVWARTETVDRVAYATPDLDRPALRFYFEPGNIVYRELVSRPGLAAFVTADVGTRRFLGVKFRHKS
jgi:hypothetical protein